MRTAILLFLLVACQRTELSSSELTKEDYVLIEFAAHLEEDYHRLEAAKTAPAR